MEVRVNGSLGSPSRCNARADLPSSLGGLGRPLLAASGPKLVSAYDPKRKLPWQKADAQLRLAAEATLEQLSIV